MSEPWTRRDDESAKAYQAFGIYRDMDPAERSLDVAWRTYAGQQESSKRATGRFTKWSTDYEWTERAEAYDAERERARLSAKGTDEIEAFRDRTRQLAAANTTAAIQLLRRASARLAQLGDAEITPQMLPAMFRAAAAVAEAGTNAEATAIGVEALLVELAGGAL